MGRNQNSPMSPDLMKKLERLERQDGAVSELRRSIIDLEIRHEELRAENERLDRAHGALDLARSHYHDLFEAAPFAYLVVDNWGSIEELNSAAGTLLGQEPSELVGTLFTAWVHGPDTAKFFDHLRRCRRSDETVRTEMRIRTSVGRIVHVDLYSRRALSSSARYATAIADVSDRERWAQERQRSEEARLR